MDFRIDILGGGNPESRRINETEHNMKTKTKFCALAAGISLLLIIASTNSPADEVLVNGGFENEPNFGMGVSGDGGYSALTGSQIPGWTIEPGHAATVHNTAFYPFISGNFSINMDGEGFNGQNANLYQDFASNLGFSYAFSFDWQGWMNNAPSTLLQVSIVDVTTAAVLFNQTYSFSSSLHHESTTFLGPATHYACDFRRPRRVGPMITNSSWTISQSTYRKREP